MTEPLFEFLRNPAPLSLPSMVLGDAVYLICGGLAVLALLAFPTLRGVAWSVGLSRWVVRVLAKRKAGLLPEPERPLSVEGLSPKLARLAQQTRTLALELRRRSQEAQHWPDDAGELELVRVRWWSSLIGDSVDMRPVLETRREVFEWIDSVEGLPTSDRDRLAEFGVDVEAVRRALTAEQAVAEGVRALAGLLWSIDERLSGAGSWGYRGKGLGSARAEGASRLAPSDDDESEIRARRHSFNALVATHGRGFSRMAGDYAKTSAEREDLEQDIALALWQALPRFRGESTIETFAYRVARYCCFRHLRRRTKHATEADAAATVDDPQACVESWLLHADELEQVERARAALPANLEAPLSLHLSGLSYAEIATQLGISEQNVSVRLTRARHRLRARLAAA
jgi:RNA polymerase sigma factor (sigma-70 family)